VAAAAAILLAGSSFALAQQFHGGREGRMFHRWQPTAEDIEAFADARISGMKAGLRLNAEQEKNWGAFEQAYRGLARQRVERFARRDEQRPSDLVQSMQRRADLMVQRAAGFKQLADAAAPLYQSLDDAQKRRFAMLARMLRPQRVMGGERGHMHRGPGRFRDRGGIEDHGPMQRGDLHNGSLDDGAADFAQDHADELEFARLGRLPAQPPER
jgi:hypothetical protein